MISYLIVSLVFLGCGQNKSNDQHHNNNMSPISGNTVKKKTEASIDNDSLLFAYNLLLKCGLIPDSFSKKRILSFENYFSNDKFYLSLVKIDGNNEYKEWNGDPVYNILIAHTGNKIDFYKSYSSVYDKDFSYYVDTKDFVIFNSYSSPVGYSEIILFKKTSNELFQSEHVEDGERIVTEDIDLKKLLLRVRDLDKKTSFKRISTLKWDICN